MSINLGEASFVRHLTPTRRLYVDRYQHQSSHRSYQYQQRLVKGTEVQETVSYTPNQFTIIWMRLAGVRDIYSPRQVVAADTVHTSGLSRLLWKVEPPILYITSFTQRFPLFVNMIKLGDSSVGSHSANCCIYNFEFSELLNLNVTYM